MKRSICLFVLLYATILPAQNLIYQVIEKTPTADFLSIDLWQVFQTIVLILGFPLAVGMLVRHFKPALAKKFAMITSSFAFLTVHQQIAFSRYGFILRL